MNTSHLFGHVDEQQAATHGGMPASFNIWDEIHAIRESDGWKNGVSRKSVGLYPEFRIDLVALKQGASTGRRANAGRISLQCMAGLVRIHTPSRSYDLPAGEVIVLGPGLWHDVEARFESAILVTVALPKADIPALFNGARWVPPMTAAVTAE